VLPAAFRIIDVGLIAALDSFWKDGTASTGGEDEKDLAEDREEKEVQEAAEGEVDLDLMVLASNWLANALEAESTDNERLAASMPESVESRRFDFFRGHTEAGGDVGTGEMLDELPGSMGYNL
jgi:hypothetical protein